MIRLISLLREAIENEKSKPKAILLAGAPGAGKGEIIKKLNLQNIKIFNIDDKIKNLSKEDNFTLDQKSADLENRIKFASAMNKAKVELKREIYQTIEGDKSFILDGTSASYDKTKELYDNLKNRGYDIMMLFVYTNLETSLKGNQERFEKSGGEDRSLMPGSVYEIWLKVYKNFNKYKELFGKDNFISVANTGKDENMKDLEKIFQTYITPYKPKDAKPKSKKDEIQSRNSKEKLNLQMKEFLDSKEVENIITTSTSFENAKTKINQFLS